MTFANPVWFWALVALPILLVLYVLAERKSARMIARIVAPRLRADLAASVSYAKRRVRFAFFLLALAFLTAAMARPQWGYEWEEAKRKGRDVILAVDTSRSMLANDLTPSRLARARLASQDLVEKLQGDRIGLIAFAGSAFLQAPLTIDYGAVLTAIQELDTSLIPRGGTNIASAIRVAMEAFGKGESGDRALIIFTDGEELDADAVKEAQKAKDVGIKIFTVGVGTPEGSLIPLPRRQDGSDFVRDRKNEIVRSKLDESRLREIADATGGFYMRLEGLNTVEQIVNQGIKSVQERETESKMSRKAIERYQWPLAIGISLLMVAFMIGDRRRAPKPRKSAKPSPERATAAATMLLVLLVSLAGFRQADADTTPETLYNEGKYDEALKAYEEKKKAAAGPELDFNVGAAAYKTKQYDKAMEAFSKALLTDDKDVRELAYYNLGNTLFQRGLAKEKRDDKIGEWKNAVQKYDDALRLDPKDENAKFNRDLVSRMLAKLEEEKKQEQQQQQQKQDQQKNDKQDQNKDQQQQEQKKDQSGQGKEDKQQQQGDGKQQEKKDQQSQGGQQGKEDQQKSEQEQQQGQGQGEGKQDEQNQGKDNNQGQGKADESNADEKQEKKNDQQQQADKGSSGEEKKENQGGSQGQDKQESGEKKEDSGADTKEEGSGKENEQQGENSSDLAKNQKDPKSGEEGEKQGENKEASKPQGSSNGNQDGKQSEEPGPVPDVGDQPREGELQAAGEEKENPEGAESEGTAGAEASGAAGAPRGLTKAEAMRLLNSLKGEDDRVMLFDRNRREPVYNDW